MLDDLLADTNSGHNIVATVFVQCRSMHRAGGPEEMRPVGETEFVNGVAAMSAVGRLRQDQDLRRHRRACRSAAGFARAATVLEAHIRAGGGRFRGIRHITAWDADPTLMNPAYAPPPGLMADATFRQGFSCLAPLNLSFDAWLYHPQIDEVTALAQAFPDTRICLNHVGGPLAIGVYGGKRDEVFAKWSASIRALAKCPNVVVKLGGMAMRINGFDFHEKADPPSSEALAAAWKPYVETCVEAFGAVALHVREQLPGGQGIVRVRAVLERVQDPVARRECGGEERSVQRHGGAVLPAGTVMNRTMSRGRSAPTRPKQGSRWCLRASVSGWISQQ